MKLIFKVVLLAIGFTPLLAFSQTNKNYIVVSYSSICCGTPAANPIKEYIKEFEKYNKLKSFEMFVAYGLGKEGEYAFYIGTDNLNNKLTQSFLSGLKDTANDQNKKRLENSDGYINVNDAFVTNSTLKNINDKSRTKISHLEVYDYKK